MLFLVEYDRSAGQLVRLELYESSARRDAEDARLELELALNHQGVDHEVVILDAANEAALRRTHRRYFDGPAEIASSMSHYLAHERSD